MQEKNISNLDKQMVGKPALSQLYTALKYNIEAVLKHLSLGKIKEGENYNHRNTRGILRIII